MTIEIKQLVVRAVVEPRREAPPAAPAPRRPAAGEPAAPGGKAGVGLDALIARAAREVLRELRKRRGR